MGDTLNSLLAANRSSTVLQGIANPAQVNPLTAMTSAAQTAGSIYGIRKLQAQQVAGQLATESIDPVTKQFDPAAYNAKIAAAGPSVAMYAQPALQDASTLSQTQLAQQHAKAGYIQGVIGALDDNSTPAQVNGALDRTAANGMFTPTDIANMRAHVPTDPAQMPAFIQQLRLIGGSVGDQLQRQYGTRESVATPQGVYNYNVPAPGRGPTIFTQAGPGPTDRVTAQVPMDQQGEIPLDASGKPTRPPSYYIAKPVYGGAVPGTPPGAAPAPVPPAAPLPTGYQPRPTGAPPAAPTPAAPAAPAGVVTGNPATPQAVPAPPGGPPGASTAPYTGPGMGGVLPAPAPRPGASLQGGVPVASVNALQPNVGPAAPPSPAVPGDVAAIMAGMQRGGAPVAGTAAAGPAAQAPQGGFGTGVGTYGGAAPGAPPAAPTDVRPPVYTSAPSGFSEEQTASAEHAGAARAKTAGYQRDIQPIEGAITALGGADTGRGGELLNNIRANIQDITPSFLQRMLPTTLTDPKARQAYEEANKYLTGMQLQAPGGARSDAGTAAAGAASPSVHISNTAAREVALAILAQRRLEQAGTLLFNQSGKSVGEFDRHMGAWNTQVDPRAFVVDKMSPDERAAYVKDLGGVGSPAYQRFKSSYQDAVASKVVPPPPGQ